MSSRPSAPETFPTNALEKEVAGECPSAPAPPESGASKAPEWPYRDIDPLTGRIRPIPAEEWRARMEDLTRRLAEIDAEDDTPDEVYDQVFRNIDEDRRRQGRPPAFEGHY